MIFISLSHTLIPYSATYSCQYIVLQTKHPEGMQAHLHVILIYAYVFTRIREYIPVPVAQFLYHLQIIMMHWMGTV